MKLSCLPRHVTHNGSNLYQYLSAVLIGAMFVNDGMFYGWTSPFLEKLQQDDSPIQITNDQGSWLAVMPLLGSILGSIIVSFTIDLIGRKRAILFTTVPFFIAWMITAFATSVEVIFAARFMVGVVESFLFTGATMYLGEISEPKIRGLLLGSVLMDCILGVLLINILGFYVSMRTTSLICSVLPVFCLVTFAWMPETPYASLMKQDQEGARRSLQTFRGCSDVDAELRRISDGIEKQVDKSGRFLDLFTVRSNRKAAYIVMVVRGFQQLSGPIAILFYTQTIFKETGSDVPPQVATFVYISVQLGMCIVSSSIIDRTGRRPLLFLSASGAAIALFIQGSYFYIKSNTTIDTASFSFVPIVALLGFVIMFSLGMQTVDIIMLGELFPTNIKAFAFCLADIYFSIIATLVSKCFQFMKDNYGMYVPFYAFAVSCSIGLVWMYFVVPETKGKTLEELQMYLRGEDKKLKENH